MKIDAVVDVLVELDKLVNGYVLGRDPNQTISAAAYQIDLAGVTSFWRESIDKMFYAGHCKQAWENEMAGLAKAHESTAG